MAENRIKAVLADKKKTCRWLVEKPLNFDPFGHAELSLFAKI